MNLRDQVCLWILTTTSVVTVRAQDGSSDAMDDISKAFVSAAVLVAVGVIAFVVAKLVDYCYDRATLNDDASDISEHTRKLIRARIALSHFKKPKSKKKKKKKPMTLKEQKKNTTRFLKLWSANAKRRGSERITDNVIKVEEANAKDKLTVNGTVKKSIAHVTFVDETGPETEGGLNVPVIAITEPEGHNSSKSTEEFGRTIPLEAKINPISGRTTPVKDVSGRSSPQKESPVKTSGRTTPVKDVSGRSSPQKESPVKASGRTTPVKDVSGRSSPQKESPVKASGRTTPVKDVSGKPQKSIDSSVKGHPAVVKRPESGVRTTPANDKTSGVNAGRSSPVKNIVKSSPLVAASGKSSPSKDVWKKDLPRSSSTSNTKLSNGSKPSSGAPRPKTAPTSRPATSNKIVAVKPANNQKNTSTNKPVPKTTSKGSPATPRSASPVKSAQGASSKPKNAASPNGGDVPEVAASTRTTASIAVSVDEDLHKKFVHFRGDSDDLMIPVSTDAKAVADTKSYQKDAQSSSSGDYEFLQSDQKKSLTKTKSGKDDTGKK